MVLTKLIKWRSQGPRWPGARGFYVQIIEILRKIFNNLLLQNDLALVLEIWYVASINFVQMKVPGFKMVPRQGVVGSNYRNTMKYIKKSSSSEPLGLDT